MDWTDDAFVLSARAHGETSAIVDLLTREHGRHKGLVRGGRGKTKRGLLQPGNKVAATWRARLAEHLGTCTLEMLEPRAARLMDDPFRLAGLSSLCAMAAGVLPEREPHGPVFDGFRAALDALEAAPEGTLAWAPVLVRWELGLLTELGFGLDLGHCAASGVADELVYVSPKSGRAVSREAGQAYKEKLLALPEFLLGNGAVADGQAVCDGLALTGYFLDRHIFQPQGKRLPPARQRLAEKLAT